MEDWLKNATKRLAYVGAADPFEESVLAILEAMLDHWPSQEAPAESSDELEKLKEDRDHFQAEAEARWYVLQKLRNVLGCPDGEDLFVWAGSIYEEASVTAPLAYDLEYYQDAYEFAVEELRREGVENAKLKEEVQHLRWHENLLRNWFNEVRSRLGLKESESNIVAVVDKVRQLTEVNHG